MPKNCWTCKPIWFVLYFVKYHRSSSAEIQSGIYMKINFRSKAQGSSFDVEGQLRAYSYNFTPPPEYLQSSKRLKFSLKQSWFLLGFSISCLSSYLQLQFWVTGADIFKLWLLDLRVVRFRMLDRSKATAELSQER